MPATSIAQKWGPNHTRVALLSASGIESAEIAKMFGKSTTWVNRVLKDPQAAVIIDGYIRDLKERLLQKFDNQVLVLAGFALNNLKRTVMSHPDIEKQFRMKQHQDKISVDVLKMAGFGAGERAPAATIQLTKEESQLLIKAVDKSNEAREIYDAEYEVIDEPNGKATPTD